MKVYVIWNEIVDTVGHDNDGDDLSWGPGIDQIFSSFEKAVDFVNGSVQEHIDKVRKEGQKMTSGFEKYRAAGNVVTMEEFFSRGIEYPICESVYGFYTIEEFEVQ